MNLVPSYNTLIVLAGTSLLGAGAGLAGCFAMLRRQALLGDALAHAGLPGLCLAFWLWGERSLPVLLLGALVSGIAGIMAIAAIGRFTRVKQDAAIGIVLSTFFGAGMVLSRMIQNRVSSGSRAGLDSYNLGKTAGMISTDVYLIGGIALVALIMIVALYKEFKLVSFDPAFARVQGWPATALDLLLTLLVAIMVVIGLPAVGVVLMAAMLILPAAAARFWTDRLGVMLVLSALIGAGIGGLGTLASAQFSLSPAGPVIVLVGTAAFTVSLLIAPRRGVVARVLAETAYHRRLDEQKVLAGLREAEGDEPLAVELPPWRFAATAGRGARRRRAALQRLMVQGFVRPILGGGFSLLPSGQQRADLVERGRKLWVALLLRYPELAHGYAELDAETIDDLLPAKIVAELEADMASAAPEWSP